MSDITSFDFTNILFSKQKVKASNKFLYVYSDKKPLVFKMPKLRIPFGLQKDTMYNKNQYILDFSLNEDLIKGFSNLDDAIISKVQKEFFNEKTEEQVRQMYSSCIKYPSNPDFQPTFRAKIIINGDIPKCDFYENETDENGKFVKIDIREKGNEPYLLNRMSKGSYNESILECIGLWFFNDRFGLSFKVSQLKLHDHVEPAKYVEDDNECKFEYSDTDSEAEFLD